MPVSSMIRFAVRISTCGLPSSAAGKRKVPISSRLYQIGYPSSSQTKSLILSAALFRKTKMFPERGSPPRVSRTSAAKLSNEGSFGSPWLRGLSEPHPDCYRRRSVPPSLWTHLPSSGPAPLVSTTPVL